MEQKPHPSSVRQCRKFRLYYSLCIGTCSGPRWPRRSASRPSSTKLMGWTSWWRAFGLCLIDQLANHPRRTSRELSLAPRNPWATSYTFNPSERPLLRYWHRDGVMGDSMRILIADDHEVIRRSVIRVLQCRGDVGNVVECAEATNGEEAVDKALVWKPDLVLLDVRLPVLAGFDAAREIKQRHPGIPVLFFSLYDTDELLIEARLVGKGFILKESFVEMRARLAEQLLQTSAYFHPFAR